MKNILILSEAYGGGVKTYIDTIITNDESFADVKFFALISSKKSENKTSIKNDFIINDNLSFGASPIKLMKSIRILHKVVKKYNIQTIHANSTFAGILMLIYSFINKQVSLIYTPHGYYSFKPMNSLKRKFVECIERMINKRSDKVIHVSHSEEREALKSHLVNLEKSVVVYNGVQDPNADKNQDKMSRFTIVNLARVEYQKNPFDFIELANTIIQDNPNVEFIWAGDGSLLEQARDKVNEYNVQDHIKFIGFSDKKDKLLNKASLLLSTSYYEGLPFSVVEAMSYKIPLLLSDIVGHKDLVAEGENGYLFKEKDYLFAKQLVEEMMNNRELWNSLSSNSYKMFTKYFSQSHMLKKMEEVYLN